jgi:hypothetical protein
LPVPFETCAKAAVLRSPPLGDVQLAEDLEARHQFAAARRQRLFQSIEAGFARPSETRRSPIRRMAPGRAGLPMLFNAVSGRFEPGRRHLVLAGVIGHHVTKSLKLQRQDSLGQAMLRDADHDTGHAPKMLAPTDDLDRDALLLDDACNS